MRDVARTVDSVQDERQHPSFWFRDYEEPDPHDVTKTIKHPGAPSAIVVVPIFRAGRVRMPLIFPIASMQELPSIRKTLPPSVDLRVIYDRAWTIQESFYDVETTLGIAFVLVVLVIYIFLGRATDTLIPVVALPLSLLLTFICMNLLGYSLDNLSLMALDAGDRVPGGRCDRVPGKRGSPNGKIRGVARRWQPCAARRKSASPF